MGFYSSRIFPRLCDFVLDQPHVAKERRALLTSVRGEILEIGFGSGLNLEYYPKHVLKITALEPNSGMNHVARKRLKRSGIAVDQRSGRCERLPFADNAFDCVVSTFTLCSVAQIELALDEVWRVIKPGGRFLFLEHGLSSDPAIAKWQRRLNWLEMRLADGCRLDRNIRELVERRPFRSVQVSESYMAQTPRTHGYMYRGIATK